MPDKQKALAALRGTDQPEERGVIDSIAGFMAQPFLGALEGMSTVNTTMMPPQNVYEEIGRGIGHLAGFAGMGGLPSIPAKVGGKVSRLAASALRGVVKNATPWYIKAGAKMAEEATKLGTMSAVSSWQQGIDGMLAASIGGGEAGAAFYALSFVPDIAGLGKAKKLARMLATSAYTGLPSTLRGDTTPQQIYEYLLGAYFGRHGRARAFALTQNMEGLKADIERDYKIFTAPDRSSMLKALNNALLYPDTSPEWIKDYLYMATKDMPLPNKIFVNEGKHYLIGVDPTGKKIIHDITLEENGGIKLMGQRDYTPDFPLGKAIRYDVLHKLIERGTSLAKAQKEAEEDLASPIRQSAPDTLAQRLAIADKIPEEDSANFKSVVRTIASRHKTLDEFLTSLSTKYPQIEWDTRQRSVLTREYNNSKKRMYGTEGQFNFGDIIVDSKGKLSIVPKFTIEGEGPEQRIVYSDPDFEPWAETSWLSEKHGSRLMMFTTINDATAMTPWGKPVGPQELWKLKPGQIDLLYNRIRRAAKASGSEYKYVLPMKSDSGIAFLAKEHPDLPHKYDQTLAYLKSRNVFTPESMEYYRKQSGTDGADFGKEAVNLHLYMQDILGANYLEEPVLKNNGWKNVMDMTKRMQIPAAVGTRMSNDAFTQTEWRTKVIEDLPETERTDGKFILRPELFDRMAELWGAEKLPNNINYGILKAFGYRPPDENGAVMLKMAVFRATRPELERMDAEGVDALAYRSAAKWTGNRKNGEVFTMSPEDFRVLKVEPNEFIDPETGHRVKSTINLPRQLSYNMEDPFVSSLYVNAAAELRKELDAIQTPEDFRVWYRDNVSKRRIRDDESIEDWEYITEAQGAAAKMAEAVGYSKGALLSKFARDYNQAKIKKYLIESIIRPKTRGSIGVFAGMPEHIYNEFKPKVDEIVLGHWYNDFVIEDLIKDGSLLVQRMGTGRQVLAPSAELRDIKTLGQLFKVMPGVRVGILSVRAPLEDVGGARAQWIVGISGDKSTANSYFVSPREMRYMGGADNDIDHAMLIFSNALNWHKVAKVKYKNEEYLRKETAAAEYATKNQVNMEEAMSMFDDNGNFIGEKHPLGREGRWDWAVKADNNYEVSTRGDKDYSAKVAKLSDGRTIEEHWQVDIKGYSSIRAGKGRPPKSKMTAEESWAAYKGLWHQYFKEHPDMLAKIADKARGKVLTDMFAKRSPNNQARAIAEILNESQYTKSAPTKPWSPVKGLEGRSGIDTMFNPYSILQSGKNVNNAKQGIAFLMSLDRTLRTLQANGYSYKGATIPTGIAYDGIMKYYKRLVVDAKQGGMAEWETVRDEIVNKLLGPGASVDMFYSKGSNNAEYRKVRDLWNRVFSRDFAGDRAWTYNDVAKELQKYFKDDKQPANVLESIAQSLPRDWFPHLSDDVTVDSVRQFYDRHNIPEKNRANVESRLAMEKRSTEVQDQLDDFIANDLNMLATKKVTDYIVSRFTPEEAKLYNSLVEKVKEFHGLLVNRFKKDIPEETQKKNEKRLASLSKEFAALGEKSKLVQDLVAIQLIGKQPDKTTMSKGAWNLDWIDPRVLRYYGKQFDQYYRELIGEVPPTERIFEEAKDTEKVMDTVYFGGTDYAPKDVVAVTEGQKKFVKMVKGNEYLLEWFRNMFEFKTGKTPFADPKSLKEDVDWFVLYMDRMLNGTITAKTFAKLIGGYKNGKWSDFFKLMFPEFADSYLMTDPEYRAAMSSVFKSRVRAGDPVGVFGAMQREKQNAYEGESKHSNMVSNYFYDQFYRITQGLSTAQADQYQDIARARIEKRYKPRGRMEQPPDTRAAALYDKLDAEGKRRVDNIQRLLTTMSKLMSGERTGEVYTTDGKWMPFYTGQNLAIDKNALAILRVTAAEKQFIQSVTSMKPVDWIPTVASVNQHGKQLEKHMQTMRGHKDFKFRAINPIEEGYFPHRWDTREAFLEAYEKYLRGRGLDEATVQKELAGKADEYDRGNTINPATDEPAIFQKWEPNLQSRHAGVGGYKKRADAVLDAWVDLIRKYHQDRMVIREDRLLLDFDRKYLSKMEKKDRDGWYNFAKDMIDDHIGVPSRSRKVFGIEIGDNALADKWNKAVGKAFPSLKVRNGGDLRRVAHLEGLYEMATLLFSPKSTVLNLIGGKINMFRETGFANSVMAERLFRVKGEQARRNLLFGLEENKERIGQWNIPREIVATYLENQEKMNYVMEQAGVTAEFIADELKISAFSKMGARESMAGAAKETIRLAAQELERIKANRSLKGSQIREQTREVLRKYNLEEHFSRIVSFMMQNVEWYNRTRSFWSGYLYAFQKGLTKGKSKKEAHSIAVEWGKIVLQNSQYLYNVGARPQAANTALGTVFYRFKQYMLKEMQAQGRIFAEAKEQNYRQDSPEYERMQRTLFIDGFVFMMANLFMYSIFDNMLPSPLNELQDVAKLMFGTEEDREKAFFGTYGLSVVQPPALRIPAETFRALITGSTERLTKYHMWTWFPFGRAARDVKLLYENPSNAVETLTGFPLHGLGSQRKQISKRELPGHVGIVQGIFSGGEEETD